MAGRTLTVQILGDSRSLERAFARSSRGAKGFERNLSATVRGSLAGSGAFRGLSRSLALASGGFLSAAAAAGAIRGAFEELNESRRVTAQTNAVLQSTGQIAGVTAEHVEELGRQLLRKTGIDDEAIRSSQNLLLTFTNLRNVAGDGNNIFDQAAQAALDLSIRFNRDLSGSAIQVGKALQDPIRGLTALRRVGVQFSESQATQIKSLVRSGNIMAAQKIILRELTIQTGGAAAAAGRVQPWKRLRETLRNISAELVGGLLPNIISTTDRIQKWVDNARNVERLKDGFKTFTDTIGSIAGTVQGIVSAFGGWKTAITTLIGAWAGFKAAGIGSAIAVQTANVVAAGVTTSAWRAALIATGWGAFAVAAGAAAAYVITHWSKVRTFFERLWITLQAGAVRAALGILEPFSHLPKKIGGDIFQKAKADLQARQGELVDAYARAGVASGKAFVSALEDAQRRQGRKNLGAGPGMSIGPVGLPSGAAEPPGSGAGAGRTGVTAAQRNAWFDAVIGRKQGRVQDVKTLQGQIGALGKIAALVRERLGITKDITRRLALEDALLDIGRQQQGLREQIASNQAEAKRLVLDKRQAAIAAERERVTTVLAARQERLAKERRRVERALETTRARTKSRQFRALGLAADGSEVVPGVKGLRKRLGNITEAVKGTVLDTGKTQTMLARIRKVLGDPFKTVSREVRSTIATMLDDVRRQLGEFKGPLTKTAGLDSKKLLAGLGLDPEQIRELRGRVSGVNSAGLAIAGGAPVPRGGGFVGARPIIVENHNVIQLDGHTVGKSVTRSQQKTKRRNPPQRRGPNRGGF